MTFKNSVLKRYKITKKDDIEFTFIKIFRQIIRSFAKVFFTFSILFVNNYQNDCKSN